MKQEGKQKTGAPKFDAGKCQETAGVIASMVTGLIGKSKPQSVAEGLLMMTLAMGRVIHVLGTVMGVDPKLICRDFCGSMTKYFEMGGDPAVGEIAKFYNQKGS